MYDQEDFLESFILDDSGFVFIMIELRSFNVERIYNETVRCVIDEELGTDKYMLEKNTPAIKEMISQIATTNGYAHLCACNRRVDGEIWTPYLQIVEMLIRMGARIGFVKYEGKLKPDTLIEFLGAKLYYGDDESRPE